MHGKAHDIRSSMLFPNESLSSSVSPPFLWSISLLHHTLLPLFRFYWFDRPLFPFCCLRIIFYSNGTINNHDDVLPIAFDEMILKRWKVGIVYGKNKEQFLKSRSRIRTEYISQNGNQNLIATAIATATIITIIISHRRHSQNERMLLPHEQLNGIPILISGIFFSLVSAVSPINLGCCYFSREIPENLNVDGFHQSYS